MAGPPADPGDQAAERPDTVFRLLVAAGVLFGIGLRIYVLTHPLGSLDSDEAVVGLMARHFLNGEHAVFFWGQAYGGSLESMVAAVPFAVFGSSVLALKMVPILFDAAGAILVWRIGRRLISRRAGLIAGIAFWIWPATYVWWSTKGRLFYASGTFLGLVMLLAALRISGPDGRRWSGWDWLVLGFAGGLGWWGTPQVVYLAVPALVWIALKDRSKLKGLPLAIPAAVLGAWPWLVWNVHRHFVSLKPTPVAGDVGYLGHLARFVRLGLPMALGLRVAYTERWLFRSTSSIAICVLLVLVGVAAVIRTGRRSVPLVVGAVMFPFLWALSPNSTYIGEGRYLFFLSPLLALLVGLAARRAWQAVAIVVVLALLTVSGLRAMHTAEAAYESDRAIPASMGPLIHALEANHQKYVFATYWIAYRLDFESRERLVATPTIGAVRWAPYDAAVRASADPVYVFVGNSRNDRIFASEMARLAVPYRHQPAGEFSVYQPSRAVQPEELKLFPG